jgi:hypothetical protein
VYILNVKRTIFLMPNAMLVVSAIFPAREDLGLKLVL